MSNDNDDIIVALEIDGEYVCRICLADEDLDKVCGKQCSDGKRRQDLPM